MRILIATDDYWPNLDGGALFERRLAHGITALGHEVAIVAPGRTHQNYLEDDPPTKIYRLKASSFLFSPRYKVSYWPKRQVRKVIDEFKPDVINIHNFYWIGIAAIKYAKKKGIKVVATNHFMPENAFLNMPLGKVFKRMLIKITWKFLVKYHNMADYVTSPTPTADKLLRDHGLKVSSVAISNGIDTNKFKAGLDANTVRQKYNVPLEPVIIYLGRVDGEKRLDILLEGFAMYKKKSPGQYGHLLIVGDGVKRHELKELAHKLGIPEHVTFAGFIPEDEKPLVYNLASVFAITSPAELQSIVTLEAMASSLPIVAVDVAALKELVHDGENGYLVPFENTHALAEKLQKILENPELAKKFGQESRKIVVEYHSTEKTFELYNNIYKAVLDL